MARVARVLLATAGFRRLAVRLGRVAVIAGSILVVACLSAYHAEHATNAEFKTVGDSFWWGIVTLTTVGYGDIVPKTSAGRFAGVAIMITGIAVLGVLAGSRSALFGVGTSPPKEDSSPGSGPPVRAAPVHAELAVLGSQLQAVERRLGELAERTRASEPNQPP